jgi:hypothetical protein
MSGWVDGWVVGWMDESQMHQKSIASVVAYPKQQKVNLFSTDV